MVATATGDRGMTIGEVAERTGLTTQGIRYYEREGLLPKTSRTHTGYRIYGPEVLSRLAFIKQARRLGLSLGEVKQILRMNDSGRAPCCQVRELLAGKLEELDRTIAELSRFRDQLRRFLSKIAGMPDQADTSEHVCRLIQVASNLVPSATLAGRLEVRGELGSTTVRTGRRTRTRT
jgi:DNA-binding transcriptional MerR regulator